MNMTRNDLPEKLRDSVCAELNQLLANTADLTLQAKQAHWALRGPNFIALHQLFDEVYGHAGAWADALAERVSALGGQPRGTLQAAASATRMEPYPTDLVADHLHVERLSLALARYGAYMRKAIDSFARLGDAGSADLVTGISREVDKDLWFVEANLNVRVPEPLAR